MSVANPTCFSDLVEQHEGRRKMLYRDSVGKLTGGVGHNFDDNGLSDVVIDFIKAQDCAVAVTTVSKVFGFIADPTNARHAGLLDMAFEMGETRLRAFVQLRACWEQSDWDGVATAAKNSAWAREVPHRATQDVALLRHGDWSVLAALG